jgi:hypothetical protein
MTTVTIGRTLGRVSERTEEGARSRGAGLMAGLCDQLTLTLRSRKPSQNNHGEVLREVFK